MKDITGITVGLLGKKEGFIYGFADLNGLVTEKLSGYPYAMSIGRKLSDDIIDRIKNGPTQEYSDLYDQVNRELQETVDGISKQFTENGIDHKIIKPTVHDDELDDDYRKTLVYYFSHKMAATRAGLGWIGKTDLFVSKKFGPRLRLTTVLTREKPSIIGTPVDESLCGNCAVCVKSCPAGAANGKPWNIHTKREEFYDAFKCREKCRELTLRNTSRNESLCGICISVCPLGIQPGE